MDELKKLIKEAYDTNELSEDVKRERLEAILESSGGEGRAEIRLSKGRRPHKRVIGIAAAAVTAAVLTVTAGAVVYNNYIEKHSDSIEQYIEGGDSLPGNEPITVSNEHLDLTIDALWSDGRVSTAIVTVVPHDEEGTTVAKKLGCIVGYADEEFDPHNWLTDFSRDWRTDQIDDENLPVPFADYDVSQGLKYRIEFTYVDIDTSRKVKLYFHNDEDSIDNIKPMITAEVSFEKNLKTVKLYNEDNDSVILSPLGLYYNTASKASQLGSYYEADPKFIKADGTEEDNKGLIGGITSSYSADGDEAGNYTRVQFKRTIDVSDYDSVILNGVKYTRR